MQPIVLASKNAGKVAELKHMLADLPIELCSAIDLELPDVEETGQTFSENALIKARDAAAHSGMMALSDDSGLSVDALDGAPGIYSARYAGLGASDQDRIQKVLSALKSVPTEQRGAQFHCVIALVRSADDPNPLICHGIWPGRILETPQGNNGFGYDPIFYVPSHDCSAAELDPDLKNTISHRARALKQLRTQLTLYVSREAL